MELVERLFLPTASKRLNELAGLLLFFCALLLTLALVSYSPADPSLNTAALVADGHTAHNWIGIFGAYSADILLQLFGFAAFLLPIMVGLAGWRWFHSRSLGAPLVRLAGIAGILFSVPTLLALLPWQVRLHQAIPQEGLLGRIVGDFLVHYFNRPGSYVLCLAILVAAFYATTSFTASGYRTWSLTRFTFIHARWQRFQDWRAERRSQRTAKREAKQAAALEKRRAESDKPLVETQLVQHRAADLEKPSFLRRGRPSVAAHHEATASADSAPGLLQKDATWLRPAPDNANANASASAAAAAAARPEPAREAERPLTGIDRMGADRAAMAAPASAAPAEFVEPAVTQRADATQKAKTMLAKSAGSYQLPPSSLLQRPDERQQVDEDDLKDLARQLTEKYAEFSVTGQVTQINPGPVVTTFEFKPDSGVKYSRVVGLSDDLCLALRAESILIERMPGKSTVGLQVPNQKRETIFLREVIEAPEFHASRAKLPLAMGKDINGRIATADLATMPHLLIAGSTGAGKSVALNAMIMSLLYRTTPDQVRLIMVDPKRLELGVYEGIPHLYTPIITEPKLAANALRNAVREMERRLKLLAAKGVRNIDQYNRLFDDIADGTPSLFSGVDEDGVALPEDEQKPLPFIVVIIDELADLMMLDKANVEESVTRLAQMARAVGIHLVLATQRPSVDVITGLIKANFPARVSFRVATKVDSRTILDANGAEALLGRGDMLYLPSGSSRVNRLHAPFVNEKEIAAVVEFWRSQGQAQYVEGFLKAGDDEARGDQGAAGEGSKEDNDDPMYDDAVRVVVESGKASTSLLQRRLRIGYGRAAHLIDLMEQDGLVGAPDGPRPREVLKRPDWLSEVDSVAR